jgi:hypothetical protein
MDPISGAGILMAGLTFPAQMFSSGVVAYTTVSEVRNMGRAFGNWYWLFKQQESRFILWGMSHKACSPGGLDENAMPRVVYQAIVPALVHITSLLENRKELCKRYGMQEVGHVTPVEPSIIRRESDRQQNVVRRLQKSSSLFRKVQWAIQDQGKFAELVQQLTTCIDTLYEMLPLPRGVLVGDAIAAETLASSLLESSRRVFDDLQQTTHPQLQYVRGMERAQNSAIYREASDSFLADQPITPSRHLLLNMQLEFLSPNSIPDPAPDPRSWARSRQSNPFSGQSFLVVEWRRYDPRRGRDVVKRILHRRIEALVTMLKEKPRGDSFRVLDCVGYFEDNLDTRFGLTFRLPSDYDGQTGPVPLSLFQAIAAYPNDIPYLGERFRLAYLLAESVHALLAGKWLHKNISSHNILLLQKRSPTMSNGSQGRELSLENPYFAGFASARPDIASEDSSRSAVKDYIKLYCHPDIQGPGGGLVAGYRSLYDIYSLGTVLIEIGLWRSLARWAPSNLTSNMDFKQILLDNVVPCLGASMGENYMNAVQKCLEGSFERLSGYNENEYDSEDYKNNVRHGLLWEVVYPLRDCRA